MTINRPSSYLDITGRRFGKLIARWPAGQNKQGAVIWLCSCDCGNHTSVVSASMIAKRTSSCGCGVGQSTRSRFTKHGHAADYKTTSEYRAWDAMIQRCHNPKTKFYSYYGGRGIKVCDRWRKSFASFIADMGKKPDSKLTLDRFPDNNGNYEPGNCRWATRKQQSANTRPPRRRKLNASFGN